MEHSCYVSGLRTESRQFDLRHFSAHHCYPLRIKLSLHVSHTKYQSTLFSTSKYLVFYQIEKHCWMQTPFFFLSRFLIIMCVCVWFLPYIDMNQPHVDMCSPSWSPLPPPSPSRPSRSSQCTNPERPVSCIEPGLVICSTSDNIHVSMLFSQIILWNHPCFSHRAQKSVLYILSLLLSLISGHHYHLSKVHICVVIYCIVIFLSDLLHSV